MTGNPRKVYVAGDSHVVSLPKSIREELGIEAGDYLIPEVQDGKIVLMPGDFKVTSNV